MSKCERCGTTENLQIHHLSYENPVKTTYLCRPCHLLVHGKKAKVASVKAGRPPIFDDAVHAEFKRRVAVSRKKLPETRRKKAPNWCPYPKTFQRYEDLQVEIRRKG